MGAIMGQSALVAHCTQSPVIMSQTAMKGAQSAGLVQPVHMPFPVSQKGVTPPQSASLLHGPLPPAPELLLDPELPLPVLPLVPVLPVLPVLPELALELALEPVPPPLPLDVLAELPVPGSLPHATATTGTSAKRMIVRCM